MVDNECRYMPMKFRCMRENVINFLPKTPKNVKIQKMKKNIKCLLVIYVKAD